MIRYLFLPLLGGILLFSACVSSKKYKNLSEEAESLRSMLQKCKSDIADCERDKNDILVQYKTRLSNADSDLSTRDTKIKSLEDQLDYVKRTNTNLLERLSDLSVISKSGAESIKKSLESMNEKDKQLSQLNAGLRQKDSLNLALVLNLKRSLSDVPSDDIQIEVKKGVVYISLSDKMLYRSGSSTITEPAFNVLSKIAKILNDYKELDILVEGHTDNVPISTACLEDNWDLSAKRATSVVRALQNRFSVDPARMTAGGRSEFEPKSDNSTAMGKKENRRTEIIILPKLDQFFKLMEKK